jgi:16S rRNA processing protein RimM
MSDLIVAHVRRPHGVAGEVLISIDTDRPRHVFRPGRVLHLANQRGEPDGRSLVLERMRPTTGGGILRLAGISTREQAAEIRGSVMLIAASEAAPADADEIHYWDLIGLDAWSDGVAIGTVEDLLEVQLNRLLLIRASGGREILIPFVKEMIGKVDVAAGRLDLKLPEGMLEI